MITEVITAFCYKINADIADGLVHCFKTIFNHAHQRAESSRLVWEKTQPQLDGRCVLFIYPV